MPNRIRALVLALVAASFVPFAFAADVSPISVRDRVLVLPKLPAGSDRPPNLPEDGAIKMPFVVGGPPGVARRINQAVWAANLDGATAPTQPGKSFTPSPDKLPQGTASLQYAALVIPAQNPRLLSLAFSGEGCGAYCEDFTSTQLFDLRDGRELSLGDLLTPGGFKAVAARVDEARRQAYRKQIRQLRVALKSARKGRSADADDGDRLALNEDCLKLVDSEPSMPQWLVRTTFSLDSQGGLALTLGRCSNHAMRGLDDVGNITVPIPAAVLQTAFTPYGLAVLRQEGDAPLPPPAFERREFHGLLGGLAITMKLEQTSEGVETRGWYAYDKYRKPIALAVRKQDGELQAVEQTADQGHMNLTAAGASFVGAWSDKDNQKQLPVVLQ